MCQNHGQQHVRWRHFEYPALRFRIWGMQVFKVKEDPTEIPLFCYELHWVLKKNNPCIFYLFTYWQGMNATSKEINDFECLYVPVTVMGGFIYTLSHLILISTLWEYRFRRKALDLNPDSILKSYLTLQASFLIYKMEIVSLSLKNPA